MKAAGIILAGGNNKRLRELTKRRATAAMPICGNYRTIDFALTNMAAAKVQRVAVLTQYNTMSLITHLSSSKWWDFGRKQGGLYVYHPSITPENNNWYRGTADAMYQNIAFLRESHEPYVIIASGDAAYKLDYNEVLEYHIAKRSDITVVTTTIEPWEDANRFGQVFADENGKILRLEEKPLVEKTREVNCGIYVLRRRLLIELLETAAEEERFDFVKDILIRYLDTKAMYAYHLDSYWSNIGSVYAYYRTNLDLLKPEIWRLIFKTGNGLLTKANDFPPAKYNFGCHVKNSLVASGTIVNGTVENSVIFKKSFIGSNCVIRNAVILNDVYIGDNTVIENCIVESHNTIRAGSNYHGSPEDPLVILENNERY